MQCNTTVLQLFPLHDCYNVHVYVETLSEGWWLNRMIILADVACRAAKHMFMFQSSKHRSGVLKAVLEFLSLAKIRGDILCTLHSTTDELNESS